MKKIFLFLSIFLFCINVSALNLDKLDFNISYNLNTMNIIKDEKIYHQLLIDIKDILKNRKSILKRVISNTEKNNLSKIMLDLKSKKIIYDHLKNIYIQKINNTVFAHVELGNLTINKNDDTLIFDILYDENKKIKRIYKIDSKQLNKYYLDASKNSYSTFEEKIDTITNNIYDQKKALVYLKVYDKSGISSSSVGTFISEDCIITDYNFFINAILENKSVVINDDNYNKYTIKEVLAYDKNFVILRLNEKGESYLEIENNITKNKIGYFLSTKNNHSFSVTPLQILEKGNYIAGVIPISKTDSGAPLFDKNGQLLGIATSNILNGSVSLFVNASKLADIQEKIKTNNIIPIKLDDFINKEKIIETNGEQVKNYSNNDLDEFKNIGNLMENIKLNLIKSSYKNGIASFRFKNDGNTLNSTLLYSSALLEQNFNLIASTDIKEIYQNKNYKISILNIYNYILVTIEKRSI